MKSFNVNNENCPSRKVLESISDKWAMLIINKLSEKTYRNGELRREIIGISQKMLTQTLRALEKNGFVSRATYPVLPLKVEYSLTDLGKSLSVILNTLTEWAENHVEKILDAQTKYVTNG